MQIMRGNYHGIIGSYYTLYYIYIITYIIIYIYYIILYIYIQKCPYRFLRLSSSHWNIMAIMALSSPGRISTKYGRICEARRVTAMPPTKILRQTAEASNCGWKTWVFTGGKQKKTLTGAFYAGNFREWTIMTINNHRNPQSHPFPAKHQ